MVPSGYSQNYYVPFEVIEETVHTALETPLYAKKYDVLNGFSIFNGRAACYFFKKFVKRRIDDACYYELIYTMLTFRLNGAFPLGFEMGNKDEFNNLINNKFDKHILFLI